jgi:hypothetical protein
LPGDDKEVASAFRKRNKLERENLVQTATDFQQSVDSNLGTISQQAEAVRSMPDHTPAQVEAKAQAYSRLRGPELQRLELLAHLQVAPFFIAKTPDTKDRILTNAAYHRHLIGKHSIQDLAAAYATEMASEKRFFHWFLEFPDVMEGNGGFDVIIGNPPFLGGLKISTNFGYQTLNWLHNNFEPAGGTSDLAMYFFRRAYSLLKEGGILALISTNTISQGDTRRGGLDYIVQNNGVINFAVRSMKWPGLAAVDVSLLCIHKGDFKGFKVLDSKDVDTITSYLDNTEAEKPMHLEENSLKGFIGSFVLGKGFILTDEQANDLISDNEANSIVLKPYLNGEDLNNSPSQAPSRWVINFQNWPLSIDEDDSASPKGSPYANEFPACLKIVEACVKPEREKQNDKLGKKFWWIHMRTRNELYRTIKPLKRTLSIALTSKTVAFDFSPTNITFAHAVGVIAYDSYAKFSVLQSSIHNQWAWKYGSTMKSDLSYGMSNIFQTFPFPNSEIPGEILSLELLGETYHKHRRQLMLDLNLGLTKTYNLFHTPDLTAATLAKAAKLSATDPACIQDLFERLLYLRQLHRQLDEAVATAYGWSDLSLEHGFHEQEYLPENDRVRYTISPAARREVLSRLLKLNHEIHAREVAEQAALALATKAAKPARKPKVLAIAQLPLTTAPEVVTNPAEPAVVMTVAPRDQPASLPDTEVLAPAAPARPPRRAAPFERTVLGGEVIHQLHGSPGFGRVKLMKGMVLLDLHALPEVDLDTHYYRQAAGPYDNALSRSLDRQFEQQKWYKPVGLPGGGVRYERLAKAGGHQRYLAGYWGQYQPEINRVLGLLRPLSMQQAEIVATLYVAWNDLLLDRAPALTDARIQQEATTAWNDSKLRITAEEWAWGFQFIRQNDLVPRGQGQHSRITPAKRG